MASALKEKLGIDIPIVQAAMGGATSPELAAAVSNSGGLGMLALGWSSPDEMRAEIKATRALTAKPFGVNLVLTMPQDERLAIALDEGVKIISLFWGLAPDLALKAREQGATVLHTVSSTAMARRAVAEGADIVVAQGWEAGGHVHGAVSTMALVPAVVDAVENVPVIAAGGIADGRGLAAAMMLGASGAWIGTRFLAASEAAIHPGYREAILAANESDTIHGTLFDHGWPDAPHRTLRNTVVEAWEAAGRPANGSKPGEGTVVGEHHEQPVTRYQSFTPSKGFTGDVEALPMWAGQGVGLVRKEQPAGEIVAEIAAEARDALRRLGADPGF